MESSTHRGQILIETLLVLAAFLLFVTVFKNWLHEGGKHVQKNRITEKVQ